MNSEDILILSVRRIIDEGRNSLKSSPAKLPVRRRTIREIEAVINSDDSRLSESIRQVINDSNSKVNENELVTLTNKIAKINHLINSDYNSIRLAELSSYLLNILPTARTNLTMQSTVKLVSNCELEITTLIDRDERLQEYVKKNTRPLRGCEPSEFDEPFRDIRNIDPFFYKAPKNPVILNGLDKLHRYKRCTIEVDRATILNIVNDVIDVKLDNSHIMSNWYITADFDITESQVKIVTSITLHKKDE